MQFPSSPHINTKHKCFNALCWTLQNVPRPQQAPGLTPALTACGSSTVDATPGERNITLFTCKWGEKGSSSVAPTNMYIHKTQNKRLTNCTACTAPSCQCGQSVSVPSTQDQHICRAAACDSCAMVHLFLVAYHHSVMNTQTRHVPAFSTLAVKATDTRPTNVSSDKKGSARTQHTPLVQTGEFILSREFIL